MITQHPSQTGDDEGDFRLHIDVLVRQKWLILALVVVSVVIAGIFSYIILPSTYESTVVVSLPPASGTDGLGMTGKGYREFAISDAVEIALRQKFGPNPTSDPLPGRYDARLDQNAKLLTVTATARTSDEVSQLAKLWVEAFRQQTQAFIQQQLDIQKASAQLAVENLLTNLNNAEDALDQFDRGTPISLMEARLSTLEEEMVGGERLVGIEARLRELTRSSIPTDEARLAFLEGALGMEPEALAGSPGIVGIPELGSGAGVTATDIIILNPVYLQLSQDLAETRTRLVTNQKELELLDDRIASLQDDIDQLREMVISSKSERNRLNREVQEANALYDPKRSELDRLLGIEQRLPELSQPAVVSNPVLPDAPVAPRKIFNVVLAGGLATLLGVFIAFFLEWYRGDRIQVTSSRQKETAS